MEHRFKCWHSKHKTSTKKKTTTKKKKTEHWKETLYNLKGKDMIQGGEENKTLKKTFIMADTVQRWSH